MNSATLICIRILVFPIRIVEVSSPRKEVIDFISFPYMISELQAPESL